MDPRPVSDKFEVPGERVLPNTAFQSLGAGSLDLVELIMAFEEEYDITIPDSDAESIRTVAEAIRLMDRFRSGRPAA